MKKLIILIALFASYSFAKAQKTEMGPIEKQMTDSLCNCVIKIDLSKITNKQEAVAAYTDCVAKNVGLLSDLAEEMDVELEDKDAMRKVGIALAKNLMKQNCQGFIKLGTKMAGSNVEDETKVSVGVFKRVDTKGFNYIVIGSEGSEKSFLWLKQFARSEQFIGPTAKLAGKKLKITWQEIEVYLPAAKGYYKVKEITAIDIL